MPSWLVELLEPGMLVSVAFVLFIIYLILRLAFKAYPFVLKFVTLVHDLVGDEDSPSIAKRMESQGAQLAKIMHEVLPNHGSSLNDSVRRTEAKTAELASKLEEHIGVTDVWHPMLDALYQDFNKKEEI